MNKQRYHYVPLKYVASDIKDGTHGTHKRAISGVPFLSAKNVTSTGRILWNEKDDCISENDYSAITSSFAPKQGDLLITVVGTLGRTALFEGSRVAFQRSVAFVRPNSNIVSDYLLQASKDANFIRQMERRSNATAQAGLYLGELAKIKIPLPTLEQQRLIAKILSTIDRTIAKTEALIEKYQQIKAGLMHDLFTRGIGADGKLRSPREVAPELYKDSAIGWIPKEWEVISLEKCGEIFNGTTPSRQIQEFWRGNIPWLSSGKINEYRISSPSELVTKIALEKTPLRIVPSGSILIGLIGQGKTRGMSARLDIDATINQNLAALIPNSEHSSVFIHQFLCHNYNRLRGDGRGSNQGALNCQIIRAFEISCPHLNEQTRIANALVAHENLEYNEMKRLRKLCEQKSGLMRDLLTGKVSVNVDLAP